MSSGHRDVVAVQFHRVMPKFSLLAVVGTLLSPWPFFLTSALAESCLVTLHIPCHVLFHLFLGSPDPTPTHLSRIPVLFPGPTSLLPLALHLFPSHCSV